MKDTSKPAGMLVTDPIMPILSTPLFRLLEAGGHEAGGGPTRKQLFWPGRHKLPGYLPSLPPPCTPTSVGVPLAEVGVLNHTPGKAGVADCSSSHLGVGCPLGKGMRENRRGSWPSNPWMIVTTGTVAKAEETVKEARHLAKMAQCNGPGFRFTGLLDGEGNHTPWQTTNKTRTG